MTKKTIIFDVGGVIVDDLDFVYLTYSEVVGKLGKEPASKEEFDRIFSPDWIRMYRALGITDSAEEIFAAWIKTYPHNIRTMPVSVYDGAVETINNIRKKHRIAINTGYRRVELDILFKRLGLKIEEYDFIVTEDMISNRKPHPESLFLLMKELNAKPEECIFVGDTISEIECGKAADCRTIAVTWGTNDKKDLVNAEPDFVVDSWQELHEVINSIK